MWRTCVRARARAKIFKCEKLDKKREVNKILKWNFIRERGRKRVHIVYIKIHVHFSQPASRLERLTCICICIYIYTHTRIYVRIYVYIYITYIRTYIYIFNTIVIVGRPPPPSKVPLKPPPNRLAAAIVTSVCSLFC